MDPHGWISIPLLASFNRVKQVTMDVQLVHEVLTLSTLVEVSGDWVRMGGQQWKQFILPNTAPSENEQSSEHMEEEVQLDEDEEEEVEFVMG
jgi:la-related protein 1